jgi:hypothetical protein
MKNDLTPIYNSSESTKVYMLQQILINNSIDAHVIDKPSSAYPWMSEYELFVHNEDVIRAIHLIRETETNE